MTVSPSSDPLPAAVERVSGGTAPFERVGLAGAGAGGGRASSETLTALFQAEEGALLQFAFGLVGRRTVAEELVQEAFLRLHPLWSEIENPRAWLYRCVRNLGLNHRRDHRRETSLPEDEGAHAELADAAATSPARLPGEELARQEAVGQMRRLLAELDPEARDLLRLKYQDDLRYHEISRRTGLNAGTVGYKLHHLLKSLAEALRRAGIEGSRG